MYDPNNSGYVDPDVLRQIMSRMGLWRYDEGRHGRAHQDRRCGRRWKNLFRGLPQHAQLQQTAPGEYYSPPTSMTTPLSLSNHNYFALSASPFVPCSIPFLFFLFHSKMCVVMQKEKLVNVPPFRRCSVLECDECIFRQCFEPLSLPPFSFL